MSQLADPLISRAFDRLPPHSIEAEKCLIGSMMNDPRSVDICAGLVTRDDFYQADHQIIFDTLLELRKAGTSIDLVTVKDALSHRELLEEIGGTGYLAVIVGSVPHSAHAPSYAATIRETSMRRQAIAISNDTLRAAYNPGDRTAIEILGEMTSAASTIASRGANRSTITIADGVEAAMLDLADGGGKLITTGLVSLDEQIGGLKDGEMWLVAARPSMGKSLLAKQIILRAAKAGMPSMLFSLEESSAKIHRNWISSEANVENNLLRTAKFLTKERWHRIGAAKNRLEKLPVYINDRLRNLDQIHAEASAMKARHGIMLIAIDYLQLIDSGGKNPYERASEASKGAARLARDLKLPVVLPTQLNRGVENREDKRPGMADLRDSGQIEQDADGIMFLHREDYYHLSEPAYQPTGIAEICIGKMRDGERGAVVKLASMMKYQRLDDLATAIDPFGDSQ